MTRRALGRGLSALLSDTAGKTEEDLLEIDIDLIEPSPNQPRTRFDERIRNACVTDQDKSPCWRPILVREDLPRDIVAELREQAVDPVERLVHVLEEHDVAREVRQVGRPDERGQHGEVAPDERALGAPAHDGVRRHPAAAAPPRLPVGLGVPQPVEREGEQP